MKFIQTLITDFKNLFIIKSIYIFSKNNRIEQNHRATLFQEGKTPKIVFSFIFFIVTLGQIGILTSIITSTISRQGFLNAIAIQGKSGNFLTFEISLMHDILLQRIQGERKNRPIIPENKLLNSRISCYLPCNVELHIHHNIQHPTSNIQHRLDLLLYNVQHCPIRFGIYISYRISLTFSAVEESAAHRESRNTAEIQKRANSLQLVDSAIIGDSKIKL